MARLGYRRRTMMHPVGSQPAAVYWRRRLVLLAAVLLVAVVAYVVFFGRGSGRPGASANPPATSPPAATHPPTSPVAHPSTTAVGSGVCAPGSLKLAAVTDAPSFKLGSQPVLAVQVTNVGTTPCVADLSDRQIELLVYNGESRVWGSHDCQVQPGTQPMTLAVRTPVRRSITWTGLSSQPQCAGTRQLVGSGTYTLHAKLAGVEGTTATFSLT
jgi:hypothetical protein